MRLDVPAGVPLSSSVLDCPWAAWSRAPTSPAVAAAVAAGCGAAGGSVAAADGTGVMDALGFGAVAGA